MTSLGKDWHHPHLKSEKYGITLTSGVYAEHERRALLQATLLLSHVWA